MRAVVPAVLALFLLAAPLLPLSGSVATACPAGETRVMALPGGPATLCLVPVPLLAADARIVQQTGSGPVEIPTAGIRTLGGIVLGDPAGFVRLVEAPGFLAGLVRQSNLLTWLEGDGTVRTQVPTPVMSLWADPGHLGQGSAPTAVRLLVQADAGFLSDRGSDWYLDALTIVHVTDGAFRGQSLNGLEVATLTGGHPAIGPVQREVDLVLAGNVPGISPLGYASLAAVYLGGPGIAWVRTSPALARPQSCLGGPYEGSLYGAVSVTMHELGHSLDLPWLVSPVLNLPAHDPWYYCTADTFAGPAPWLCTSMGGWHGEGTNCMEVLAPRHAVYATSGVLAPVLRAVGLADAGAYHQDA